MADTVEFKRLDVQSNYGIIYLARSSSGEHRIFKYQTLSNRFERNVWELERRNSEFINHNLEQSPDLPYPYTYQSCRCGQLDIESLTQPSCPPGEMTGVIVQQYIDNLGLMNEFVDLNLLIEGMAVLAEAHQGDKVQHHFMHLDAHPGNFMVSECPSIESRTTDLGGIEYRFNTYGYRVVLFDFGLSHFLDDETTESYNCDLPDGTVLGTDLRPAYDFIMLYRSGMRGMIENIVGAQIQGQQLFDDETINHLTIAFKIGTAMIASHIKNLASRRLQYQMISSASQHHVSVYDLDNMIVLIDSTNQRQLQEVLIQLVEKVMDEVIAGIDPEDATPFLEVIEFLTGRVSQTIGDRPYLDRSITIEQLEPLNEDSLRLLSVNEVVPELTGIPLYLWYLNSAGVPVSLT